MELTLPILVATICILIVYLPIMFYRHHQIPLRALAMTVAFAMLADYVVSMSVTPVVLAWLYQAGQRKTAGHEDSADEGWFRYVLAVYEPLLQGGLRFKPLVIGLAAVALVATGALLIPRLHTPGSSQSRRQATSRCRSPRLKAPGLKRPRLSWDRSNSWCTRRFPRRIWKK